MPRACPGSPGGEALTPVTAAEPRAARAPRWEGREVPAPAANPRAGQVGGRREVLSQRLPCARAGSTSLGRLLGQVGVDAAFAPRRLRPGEVLAHGLFLTAATKTGADDQVAFTVFFLTALIF